MFKKIKLYIRKNKILYPLISKIYLKLNSSYSFESKNYWDKRYAKGGNSGHGSYGQTAKFKAEIINKIIKENSINSAIEFGCGDGNQLSLLNIKNYTGLDVSKTIIKHCMEKFKDDKQKSFFIYDPLCFRDSQGVFHADLSMSLDVIYHITEDYNFHKYMEHLFNSAQKYVLIFSNNTNKQPKYQAQHVRQRKFTDWIKKNKKDWKLESEVKSPLSLMREGSQPQEEIANFYLYKKN